MNRRILDSKAQPSIDVEPSINNAKSDAIGENEIEIQNIKEETVEPKRSMIVE